MAERSEAIIGINVPNGISIGIMVAFWAVLLVIARKFTSKKKGLPATAVGPVFSS